MLFVNDVWSDEGDDEVEKPVCGGCHRQSLGSDLQREDFSCNHPSNWTPYMRVSDGPGTLTGYLTRRGKSEDEHTMRVSFCHQVKR